MRGFQASCVARPLPDGYLDAIVAESRKVPARVWKAYLRALLDAEVPTELGRIAAPTLVLWGDRDAFCPRADQDALLAAIPGARLAIYPGTGHCPHWEEPRRAAAHIAGLAGEATRRAGGPLTRPGVLR